MPESENPFFQPSTLPYQLPPFAEIRPEHYAPALEQGMREQRDEIKKIVAQEDPPSFENTILALELSGQTLHRVLQVFYNLSSSNSSDFIAELEEEYAPKITTHEDSIHLDPLLYARIDTLYQQRKSLTLDPESRYLIERYHTEFRRAGADLNTTKKALLRDCNQQLSTLSARFEKHLLADSNELAVHFETASELDGITPNELSAAAQSATDRGLSGYLITLVLFTGHPYLARLTNPSSRERIMTASRARGCRGGEHDTRQLILEIVTLRAKRAALLGFESHAAYVAADETAKTPEKIADMLRRLTPAALRNAAAEGEQLQALRDREQRPTELRKHDWAFYSEQVRHERYHIDMAELQSYFELERVLRDGVFFAATRLYGIRFTERNDLVSYHPDARIFEVHEENGSPLGLYIADFYTRDSKRGGAWMNSLVDQSDLLGTQAVVVNNLNIPRPAVGEPTLLSYDEATTLFHEFGHALHGLFAHVQYPQFAGTNVHRDFVEFPSQVNEMWLLWPEVLENYAVHYQTGERMPQRLVQRLRESQKWGEGFATTEYLAATQLDQAWHRLSADQVVTDTSLFEQRALHEAGFDDSLIPPRYSSTYFAHIFAGGYDAGYYSYIWSEILDADTVAWFTEHGGLTRDNGDRFRRLVLEIGGSRDPLEAYREFRGRDAVIEPLLERRGLV